MSYESAMNEELRIEYNSKDDYHSELWDSERKSMQHEGEMNRMYDELLDLKEQLESGLISEACYLIRSRRIK